RYRPRATFCSGLMATGALSCFAGWAQDPSDPTAADESATSAMGATRIQRMGVPPGIGVTAWERRHCSLFAASRLGPRAPQRLGDRGPAQDALAVVEHRELPGGHGRLRGIEPRLDAPVGP